MKQEEIEAKLVVAGQLLHAHRNSVGEVLDTISTKYATNKLSCNLKRHGESFNNCIESFASLTDTILELTAKINGGTVDDAGVEGLSEENTTDNESD